MMMPDDEENIEEAVRRNDIDKCGYLQKKTSKGLWGSRFFATDTRYLRYWHDKDQHTKGEKASEEFDIAEISKVEKADGRILKIQFLKNTKFQLTIKAETEAETIEWMEIIKAKVKLYSVDELLAELVGDRMSFRTKTFQTLLVLTEKEQNKWILHRLDEAFESSREDQHIMSMRSSPCYLLKSAGKAFDDFLDVCQDCKSEMTSKSPRIIAHSRNLMQRYAEIVKGRSMLELLYLPGIEKKNFELFGEQGLCAALELAQKLEDVKQYTFIPKEFSSTLASSLFSFGDLLSALLNLSLRRVDSFFEVIPTLPAELHAKKFADMPSLIGEFMQLVSPELVTQGLFVNVMDRVMTTLLLSFNDYFLNWDTSVYEERHFIAHVQACDTLQTKIGSIFIDTIQRKLVMDAETPSDLSTKGSVKNPDMLFVSLTVQDAVKSTCASSAYTAVTQLVRRLQDSKLYLLQGLLVESNMAWLTGQLCSTFVSNLDQWCCFVSDALPKRFINVLYVRVSRLMLSMYLGQMVDHHRENKRSVHTEGGVRQIVQDLIAIKAWMSRTCQQQAAAEEQIIITLQSFLLVSQKDMTQAFSEALLSFGTKYSLHLYDLLRLALKYRPDVSNSDRKAVLGLCLEFSNQVQKAMSADSFSFSLPTVDCTILDDLLPMVGVEFCTGRKWKLAPLPDPNVVKTAMAVLVGETCNKAMASKRATMNISAGKKASEATRSPQPSVPVEATVIRPVSTRPPPPPPPRRRVTLALPSSAHPEDRSACSSAAPSPVMDESSSSPTVPAPQTSSPPPPPPPPLHSQTPSSSSAATTPSTTPVVTDAKRPSTPQPPPKPARRASTPAHLLQPSSATAGDGVAGDGSGKSLKFGVAEGDTGRERTAQTVALSAEEALQLMLEAAKKSIAAKLPDTSYDTDV